MKQLINQYRRLILIFFAYIILFVLIGVGVLNLIKTTHELQSTKSDVEKLQKKLAILASNKALTQSQIDTYNALLTQLIPNQEDYFSILFALEQLSLKSGFIISKYSISPSKTVPEKLQVSVEGDGDSQAFLRFLQDYQFAGGRLITNETIEYASDKAGQIGLTLNFYSKKIDPSIGNLTQLTPKQIELMRNIQDKTTVVFKDESVASTEYKTKSNPF